MSTIQHIRDIMLWQSSQEYRAMEHEFVGDHRVGHKENDEFVGEVHMAKQEKMESTQTIFSGCLALWSCAGT